MTISINFRYIMCAISGIIAGLAHQPFIPGFIAWVCLFPLIYSLNYFTTMKRSLIAGWIFGVCYVPTIIFWLSQNIGTNPTIAWITLLASTLFLAFNYMFISGLFFWIRKRVPQTRTWILAIIWTGVEFIRSFGILGFPWISLGNTQSSYFIIIQIVEFTSVYGLTFWLVSINSLLFEMIFMKRLREIIIFILIFSFPFILGILLIDKNQKIKENIKVGIIQPNIHLDEKWGRGPLQNVNDIIKLSENALSQGVDLLIWPETAITTFMNPKSKMYVLLNKFLSKHNNVHLLTGMPEVVDDNGMKLYYNSIGQFSKDKKLDVYRKIHPVPLAEYIPMASIFPILKNLKLGQANWEIGNNYTVFETSGIKYSGAICFESTFPDLMRKFVVNGAEFLTVLVNDGWYETAPEPQQHAAQSIFRAIENRRTLLRCANTGISMVIEPSGRIVQQTNLNEKQFIIAEIYPNNKMTFFTKYGNLFSLLMILILFIIIGVGLKNGKK